MPVEFNGDGVKAELRQRQARVLLAMAVTVQAEFMKRLGRSNPRPYATPSTEGEYLRLRTGWLVAHILFEPASLAQVAREGAGGLTGHYAGRAPSQRVRHADGGEDGGHAARTEDPQSIPPCGELDEVLVEAVAVVVLLMMWSVDLHGASV